MSQSLLVLEALVPVIVVIGVGALLRKYEVLREDIERGMMQMVVQVLLPALTLANIIGNESLDDWGEVGMVAGFGCGGLLVGLALAYGFAGLMGMQKGDGKRTFGVTAGIQNYGFMGVPLLLSLFPGDDLLGVLFTHNVGVELAMWTVGVSLMSGDKNFSWRLFMKAPIIAVVVGLLINAVGLDPLFEGAPMAAFQMLGAAAIPIALIVIGAGLVELLRKERFDWKVAIGAVVVRLVLIPACMIGAAYALPISLQLKQVMVIQAAMPAAMFPIVLAKHYGGKPEVAVQVVVATTVACFVTMPFVIVIGMWALGL
ncbi:AEC family transporter [Rubritalea tangerina]|uniref:AEC family transporter n=1 Tax=Rubritalea tangerina TaxID=430798 RepID=A0ABW4ZEU8_9BACT